MKTATITWITYKNFGTYLQAYALQQCLYRLGVDNDIISDNKVLADQNKKNGIVKGILIGFLIKIKKSFFNKKVHNKSYLSKYDDFEKKFLKINYSWNTYAELNNQYECFVCGSDQIWFPTLPFNPYYYLGFTDKKKIAYAPSIGAFTYPDEKVSLVKPYLDKFDYLSVREEQGTQIIKEKFGLPCVTVLDPTLLLDKADWEKFVVKRTNEQYVLCYLLTYNEVYLNYVKSFSQKRGIPLRIFITDSRLESFADQSLYVGPQEFLNEIRNSSYFFTDSFHGSVFSIQFEKNFVTFKRFKDNAENNQNSRIINLFSKLGLMERFLSEDELSKGESLGSINYQEVKSKLKKERESSLRYLQKALMSE